MSVSTLIALAAEDLRLRVQLARLTRSRFAKDRFRDGYLAALMDRGLRAETLDSHRQVEVYGVEVDEGMADLLGALWRLGIETQFSCQGEPDRYVMHQPAASQHDSHIVFSELDVAVRFLKRTLDLLGECPWREGWLELTVMQPLRGVGQVRGRVGWPPALQGQITDAWVAYEKTVPVG